MLSTTISFSSSLINQLQLVSRRTYPGIVSLKSRWDFTRENRRSYAKPAMSGGIAGLGKKKLGKAGPVVEKRVLPVETDPVKLVTYCCGLNILKEGGEEVKLKEDSEYPDWLWSLNTGPSLPLEQLDPDTDEYWERAVSISKKRWTSMQKLKRIKG